MTRFNSYFNSLFRGCHILARKRDESRGRDVSLYAIPGEETLVGVFDGHEAFIAPVSNDPYSANVARLLADLKAGKPFEIEEGRGHQPATFSRPRKRVITSPQDAPRTVERKRVQVIGNIGRERKRVQT